MDDYDLIEASFLSQYGIRLRTSELQFDEFLNLVSCLMPESPLGQVVAIRSEDDPEVLKEFTQAQKDIRNEWRSRERAKDKPKAEQDYRESMDALFAAIRA